MIKKTYITREQAIELLKRLVTEWNAYRNANPEWKPDLKGANLGGADLSGANLSAADLSEANLRGANLQGVILSGADLRGADLRGADLIGAGLYGANLGGADLREANLSGADLIRADLKGANLGGADLREANLRLADLHGADLRGADLRRAYMLKANINGAIFGEDVPSYDATLLPRIKEIVLANADSLDMKTWHACATTHCLAGWAIYFAGIELLEDKYPPHVLGARLLGHEAEKHFYDSNEEVIEWLQSQ